MGKLLKAQDILLLGLSAAADLFFEFKNAPMAEACENLYGWIPPRYQKTNFLQTVSRSLRVGYLEKVVKNGEVFLRLTGKGEKLVRRDFSISRWQGRKWDRRWRLVIFDISEEERDRRDGLRRKLKELGLGMLQKSIWITPYDFMADLRDFLQSQGLENKVFVLETSSLVVGDPREFTACIWPLKKINERYRDLFYTIKTVHDREEFSMEKIREWRGIYLEILREDPALPDELLPKDWFGEKVGRLLKRLT